MIRNANAAFEEFDRNLQNRNYRQAYELWSELQQHIQEGHYVADLVALRRQLDDESRQLREELINELERLKGIRVEELDLNAFEYALQSLYDASAPDDQADYETYKVLFDDRKSDQRRLQEYNRARTLVEDQWEQAIRLSSEQRDIAGSALLPYYTRALDIAKEAFDRSPNNTLLKILVEQATARRNSLDSEEEIMTSGGQVGDFVRVLTHINGLREGEAVMVYDNDGTPKGRMLQEDARATVEKNAMAYVNQKAPEYSDKTDERLRAFDARGAETALREYDKFIELERLIPDVFRPSDRNRYNELAKQTVDALQKLEQAEGIAERARKAAADNPRTAWTTFLQALPVYQGVFHSEIIVETLDHIGSEMLRLVQSARQSIAAHIAEYNFEVAYRDAGGLLDDYRPLVNLSTEGLHEETVRFLDITLNPLRDELKQIERHQKDADNGIQKRKTINVELHDIGELPREQVQEAARRLAALVRQYGDRLVERDPLYLEVSSRVKTAQDASRELTRLRTYLDDNDIDQVRAAQKAARDAVQGVAEVHRQNFSQLVAQLGRHIEELEAAQSLYTSGYDEAIRRYQALARQPDLGDVIRPRVEQMLDRLQQERDLAEDNNRRLRDLESLLNTSNAGEPEDVIRRAWTSLEAVEGFTDPEQRSKWLNLLRRSFESLAIDTSFAINRLDDLLARADGLNPTFIKDAQKKRLDLFKSCQRARDQQAKSENDNALMTWRRLEDMVSGDERDYVIGRIRDLTKRKERASKDHLIGLLSQRGERDNLVSILADMTDGAAKYRKLAADATEPLDRVEYLAWAVELDLFNAQYRPEIITQREMLHSASQLAQQQLAPALREVRTYQISAREKMAIEPVLNNARDVLRRSEYAAVIASAMEKVENYLREDSDIGLFGEAVAAWEQAFVPPPGESGNLLQGYFEPLRGWYATRAGRIYQDLRTKVQDSIGQTQAELAPENLPRYAKLLLLNPDDDLGKAMLRQLALSGEILRRRFVDLINDLPAGLNHTGAGDSVLRNQIEDLREQQAFFLLVIDIAQRFPAALRQSAGRNAESLADDSRRYNTLLGDVLRMTTQLKQKVEEFQDKLNSFGLDEPIIHTYEAILFGYFEELQENAKAISRDLAELFRRHSDLGVRSAELERLWDVHPVMRTATANRNTLTEQCSKIAEVFSNVRNLAEEEEFAEAQSAIEHAPFYDIRLRELLARSPLRENFTVQDRYTRHQYRGWEQVGQWIRERRAVLERILAWPVPDEAQVVGWQRDGEPVDIADQEYYEWLLSLIEREDFTQAVREQVNAMIAAGDFDRAHALVRRATYAGGALPNNLLSLEEARDLVSRFPLADQENAHTSDINEALQHSGSQRGREYLESLYENRFQLYHNQFQEAEQLLRVIDEREQLWERLYSEFSAKLTPVGDLIRQAKRTTFIGRQAGLSPRQKQELEEAYNAVRKHISQIEAIFPHHQQLWQMKNLSVLINASELL